MDDAEYMARVSAGLEPAAVEALPDIDGRIRLSTAVSLKRIADALQGSPGRYGINELVESVREAGKI